MSNTKKVNVLLLCLASIFIPTGVLAFRQINKLKMGFIIYAVSIIIGIIGIIIGSYHIKMILDISTVSIIISYLMPIAFMNKYCKEWNKKIISEIKS